MTGFFLFVHSIYLHGEPPPPSTPHLPTLLCSPLAEFFCTGLCWALGNCSDEWIENSRKASKGKCGNRVVRPLIKLVLLGSCEWSTSSASAAFPKIPFVTPQNVGYHLLNDCNVTGTVLRSVCALCQLILMPVLWGIAGIIPFLQPQTLVQRG